VRVGSPLASNTDSYIPSQHEAGHGRVIHYIPSRRTSHSLELNLLGGGLRMSFR